MTKQDIEHMWKVANNNPNHDTNWHDPVVVKFAKMVAAHTLMNIDPSIFMSHQEGIEVGRLAEREACAVLIENTDLGGLASDSKLQLWVAALLYEYAKAIRARGNT